MLAVKSFENSANCSSVATLLARLMSSIQRITSRMATPAWEGSDYGDVPVKARSSEYVVLQFTTVRMFWDYFLISTSL